MDHDQAIIEVNRWGLPWEQKAVYLRVLGCVQRCDLPDDVKVTLRALAMEKWALEAVTVETSEQ